MAPSARKRKLIPMVASKMMVAKPRSSFSLRDVRATSLIEALAPDLVQPFASVVGGIRRSLYAVNRELLGAYGCSLWAQTGPGNASMVGADERCPPG